MCHLGKLNLINKIVAIVAALIAWDALFWCALFSAGAPLFFLWFPANGDLYYYFIILRFDADNLVPIDAAPSWHVIFCARISTGYLKHVAFCERLDAILRTNHWHWA